MIKNVALITYSMEGAPIIQKLQEEGVNVLVGVIENRKDILTKIEHDNPEDKESKKRRLSSFDGVFKKYSAQSVVNELKKVPEKERREWFIFCDFNHCWKYAEQLLGMGFNGIFPTEEDRMLEVDRDKAKKFVDENYPDIDKNRIVEFKDIEKAKEFLKDADVVYVLKGKDEDCSTIVPRSEEPENAYLELEAALDKEKEQLEKSGFILEAMIDDAIEHTIQAVFNNGKLCYLMNDIECKPKAAGDKGELTGCSTDLIFEVKESDKLSKIGIPKVIYDKAKEHEGVMFWDASLLINKKNGKIYFGEFCANRPGYNCFYDELSLMPSVKDWFESVSEGKNPMEKRISKFAGSIRIFSDEKEAIKDQYYSKKDIGFSYSNWNTSDLWAMDMKMEDDKMKTVGWGDDLAVITGQGDSIEEVAHSLYKNIEDFVFESKRWTYRYKGDFLATDYPKSIINRYEFGKGKLYETSSKD